MIANDNVKVEDCHFSGKDWYTTPLYVRGKTVTIKDVKIQELFGGSANGLIHIYSDGAVTIDGGEISNSQIGDGAIYIYSGLVTVTGGLRLVRNLNSSDQEIDFFMYGGNLKLNSCYWRIGGTLVDIGDGSGGATFSGTCEPF